MAQKVVKKINWQNIPATETPINEDNLNQMDSELDAIDDRVVALMGYEERVEEAATETESNALDSKSWAVGGTGIRENENTDNSKYYSERARSYSQNASAAMESAEHWAGIAQELPQTLIESVESNTEAIRSLETENEEQDKKIDSQNVHFATGKEINVPTKKGGIRIDEVKGSAHKSVNLLKQTLGTQTLNGVTLTNNGDGTYTVNGTASANAIFTLATNISLVVPYRIVGCPSGGDKTKYYISLELTTAPYGILAMDIGNGQTYSPNTVVSNGLFIVIKSGTTVNNLVFKPMITTDLSATYDDYEPYGVHTAGGLGFVDLADIAWFYSNDNTQFYSEVFNDVSAENWVVKSYCNKYIVNSAGYAGMSQKHARGFAGGRYYIIDTDYTDVNSFVAHLKADKVHLAYELADGATPTSYAEVVLEHGKNWFDINGVFSKYNSANTINVEGNNIKVTGVWYVYQTIKVKKNTIYYISGETISYTVRSRVAILTKDHNNFIKDDALNSSFDTGENDTIVIALYSGSSTSGTTVYGNLMLEEGTEATEYVPYEEKTVITPLKYPLASIGDVANTIDENGKHYKIACVDLGSLSWTNDTTTRSEDNAIIHAKYAVLNDCKKPYWDAQDNILMCDKYGIDSPANIDMGKNDKRIGGADSNGRIWIYDSEYNDSTAEQFKTAMSGIMLYYELATEETEPLDTSCYQLESYEGQTYIDTADTYAKATLSVGYGKSENVAQTIKANNDVAVEKMERENDISELSSVITESITTTYTDEMKIAKNGNVVMIVFATLKNLTGNAATTITTLPQKFRPIVEYTQTFVSASVSSANVRITIRTNGEIVAYNYSSSAENNNVKGSVTYISQ